MGLWVGVGLWGCPMHTCTCMLNMINMDASMGWPFAISIHVYFSVRHVHMHMHHSTPDTPTSTSTHTPTRASAQIIKCLIKLEQIKIIQFCLKIWDLCTFLDLCRLGLVCIWGCPITNSIFYFWAQKSTCVTAVDSLSPETSMILVNSYRLNLNTGEWFWLSAQRKTMAATRCQQNTTFFKGWA